jgi:hypothetical protein
MADAQVIFDASTDPKLNDRTTAIVVQECYNNPNLSQSDLAAEIKTNPYGLPKVLFAWPVAIAVQEDYANGGADSVTDLQILGAVQANWPEDPEPEPDPEL